MAKRAKKESKRTRYMRLFDAAAERIQRGEVVYIGLESASYEDAQTCRTYWYHWKIAQRILATEPAWLEEVQCSLVTKDSRLCIQMVRKSVIRGVFRSLHEAPLNTVLLTGEGSSIVNAAPIHAPKQDMDAFEQRQEAFTSWYDWIALGKRDLEEHMDVFSIAFDSAEGIAYRARYGG